MVPIEGSGEADDTTASRPLVPTIAKVLGKRKHSLDDEKVVVTGKVLPPHSLESDATAPSPAVKTELDHDLCQDPMTDLANVAASHELPTDKTTHFANLKHGHNLGRDVRVDSSNDRATSHGLSAHKPTEGYIARPAHQLENDATISSESRYGTGHALNQDAKGDTASKRSDGKHKLEEDAAVSLESNKGGSHKLDEE